MTEAHDALVEWYDENWWRRFLPWRHGAAPVWVACFVEALLPRTRAEVVASALHVILEGVLAPSDWLNLPVRAKEKRCSRLGLPIGKVRVADRVCRAIDDGRVDILNPSRYVDAAVLVRLGDKSAVPVDGNVERVSSRLCGGGMWQDVARSLVHRSSGLPISEIDLAGSEAEPEAYRAFCAVLDVGALYCRRGGGVCRGCPLDRFCRGAA